MAKTSHGTRSFNSSSERFDQITNDNPGAGKYYNGNTFIKSGPSVSKKGYGGFVSKKEKLVDLYPRSDTPGVGTYEMQREAEGRKVAFTTCGKHGRVPYDIGPSTPGPYDYRIKLDVIPKLLKDKESYYMCSKSNRESFLAIMSDAPGIGTYTLPDEFQDPKKTSFQWSKSRHKRFEMYNNSVPPSTTYYNSDSDNLRLNNKGKRRTAGNFRGKYIGKQYDCRKDALHTFGADTDRFKHTFFGRLDLQALSPGPNEYKVVFSTQSGERCPSPPVFRSRSEARTDIVKYGTPSPMYYKPEAYVRDKPSQCKNVDGRWL